ncbi:hypothetical protein FAZ69_20185 [Trinickia terrae]|uniref:Type III secretion protein HpaP n=1 Tax=Trinickia terrae TaxID=2571161 RepID=A0A4U1I1B5_9BURK|nr:type III secretion system protein SctP [Trinickia terrae]TKC86943.1 hypothetical protein FAZ69_20185 [Trinickia terrae]
MHSSGPHGPRRARVIAGPPAHTEHEPATQSAQLRRKAELFRLLRAGAHAGDDASIETPGAPAEMPETPCEPEALAPVDASRDEAHGGNDENDGGSRGDDDHGDHGRDEGRNDRRDDARDARGSEPAESASGSAPEAAFPAFAAFAPPGPHVAAVHAAHAANRFGAPVAAVEAPARAGRDMQRLVESIVCQVADFCSNPAVLERGDWRITLPIDSPLLPDCKLSLALSRFELALRFDTSDERSRQLILQHATTLRDSLGRVMQTRFDAAHSIEIIVT